MTLTLPLGEAESLEEGLALTAALRETLGESEEEGDPLEMPLRVALTLPCGEAESQKEGLALAVKDGLGDELPLPVVEEETMLLALGELCTVGEMVADGSRVVAADVLGLEL